MRREKRRGASGPPAGGPLVPVVPAVPSPRLMLAAAVVPTPMMAMIVHVVTMTTTVLEDGGVIVSAGTSLPVPRDR